MKKINDKFNQRFNEGENDKVDRPEELIGFSKVEARIFTMVRSRFHAVWQRPSQSGHGRCRE